MDHPANDLAAVIPPERRLCLGGVEYVLRPVSLGQLPGVIAALRPVSAALIALKKVDEFSAEGFGGALLAVLLEHPMVLLDALTAASAAPRAAVESADMGEAVDLLGAVIELNVDFFVRAVAPKLAGLIAAAGSVIPTTQQPGPTPSSA